MASNLKSDTSSSQDVPTYQSADWLKLGVVAAVSALAGGVAAAWWYKMTLTKLRQAGENYHEADYREPGADSADDA